MPTTEPVKRQPRSKSTAVAFAVLGYLDGRDHGASLAAIARALGVHEETLRPYLNELINQRKVFLDRESRHFHLDPDGPPVRPVKADMAAIRRVLEQFSADSGRDVGLAVLTPDGLRLPVYVEPRSGPALLAGLRPDSAHATASGHALLSGRPRSYLRRYFERIGMPALTDASPTSIEALLPHLQPGARGIWSARGQYCTEGACIAVIAREDRHAANRFALTTSIQMRDYQRERHQLRDRLLQTAGELQPVLGPLNPGLS